MNSHLNTIKNSLQRSTQKYYNFWKIYLVIISVNNYTVNFQKSVQENEVTTSPIGHANLSCEENGIDMLTEANLKVNGL